MNSKEEKILSVTLSLFAMEARRGHLKWKVTELESKSGVSRTLIYRYFGRNKKEILGSAFSHFIDNFYGFASDKEEPPSAAELITRARKLTQKTPEVAIFYQRWRQTETSLKNTFEETEAKLQAKLADTFNHLSQEEIVILHALIHGLVTAPFLAPEQACAGAKLILERVVQYGVSPG